MHGTVTLQFRDHPDPALLFTQSDSGMRRLISTSPKLGAFCNDVWPGSRATNHSSMYAFQRSYVADSHNSPFFFTYMTSLTKRRYIPHIFLWQVYRHEQVSMRPRIFLLSLTFVCTIVSIPSPDRAFNSSIIGANNDLFYAI